MNIKKCILCVSALISFMASYAQTITYSASNKSLTDVLHDIEQISPYRFSYNSDIIQADKTISITITNASINAFLAKILPSKYNYTIVGTQVIITEKKQQNIKRGAKIELGASLFIFWVSPPHDSWMYFPLLAK